jgi:hypothetical protein
MLYAVYRLDTGALVSETTLPVTDLAPEYGVEAFEDASLPPRRQWDAATRTYVARPLNVRPQLRRDEMARRFTIAERVALKTAKRTHPNETVRSRLEILEEDIILPERFDVTDPYLIAGVTYAVDALVQLGVVTAQNRDARIAELLVSGKEE